MNGKLMSKFIFVVMICLLPGIGSAAAWQNGWEGGYVAANVGKDMPPVTIYQTPMIVPLANFGCYYSKLKVWIAAYGPNSGFTFLSYRAVNALTQATIATNTAYIPFGKGEIVIDFPEFQTSQPYQVIVQVGGMGGNTHGYISGSVLASAAKVKYRYSK